jgi:hypothetical protein
VRLNEIHAVPSIAEVAIEALHAMLSVIKQETDFRSRARYPTTSFGDLESLEDRMAIDGQHWLAMSLVASEPEDLDAGELELIARRARNQGERVAARSPRPLEVHADVIEGWHGIAASVYLPDDITESEMRAIVRLMNNMEWPR